MQENDELTFNEELVPSHDNHALELEANTENQGDILVKTREGLSLVTHFLQDMAVPFVVF